MNKGSSMSDKPLALKHQNLKIGKRKVVQLLRHSRGYLLVSILLNCQSTTLSQLTWIWKRH
jgi:hypothetical protein